MFSAGTEATRVRPEAISVMAEIGVDISARESDTLDRYLGEPLDLVVTVCDDANEACPVFPGARQRRHLVDAVDLYVGPLVGISYARNPEVAHSLGMRASRFERRDEFAGSFA